MKPFFSLIIAAAVVLAGCKNAHPDWSKARQADEAAAAKALHQAREAMGEGRYADVRQAVDSLRSRYPLAFEARTAAILLLDSVCIAESQHRLAQADSLLQQADSTAADSLQHEFDELVKQVRFYHQKLKHDRPTAHTHGSH